jgi:hypothetical protein
MVLQLILAQHDRFNIVGALDRGTTVNAFVSHSLLIYVHPRSEFARR